MGAPKKSENPEAWEDPYRKPRSWKWLAYLILLPLLYVLSFGPALWLREKGKLSKPVLANVYSPLVQLMKASPMAHSVITFYANLWISDKSIGANK